MTDQTIYEKYGGFATVSALVHDFYERVLDSDTLARYFATTNMKRLIKHQVDFFCHVLGGPNNYTGRDIAAAHARAGITEDAFDEVAELLRETLEDAGVEADDVAAVMTVVLGTRSAVVSKVA